MMGDIQVLVLSTIIVGLLYNFKVELVYCAVDLAVLLLGVLPEEQREEFRDEWLAEIDVLYARGRSLGAARFAVSLLLKGVWSIRREMTEFQGNRTSLDEARQNLKRLPESSKNALLTAFALGVQQAGQRVGSEGGTRSEKELRRLMIAMFHYYSIKEMIEAEQDPVPIISLKDLSATEIEEMEKLELTPAEILEGMEVDVELDDDMVYTLTVFR